MNIQQDHFEQLIRKVEESGFRFRLRKREDVFHCPLYSDGEDEGVEEPWEPAYKDGFIIPDTLTFEHV